MTKVRFPRSFFSAVVLSAVALSVFLLLQNRAPKALAHDRANAAQDSPDSSAYLITASRGYSALSVLRLMRPVERSIPGTPSKIRLADLVYNTGANHHASITTLWVSSDSTQSGPVFTQADSTVSALDLANNLASGRLKGTDFILLPTSIDWMNWDLSVSKAADPIGNGTTAPLMSTAFPATHTSIIAFPTDALTIPLGFGQNRICSWIPFFDDHGLVLVTSLDKVLPDPAWKPNLASLGDSSGFIFGTNYLNRIFLENLQARTWTFQVGTDTYSLGNLQFTNIQAQAQISGALINAPSPAKVTLLLTLAGPDLTPNDVTVAVDCNGMGTVDCLALEGKMQAGAAALSLKLQHLPSPIRPSGPVDLGTFFISALPLKGTLKSTDLSSQSNSLTIVGDIDLARGVVQ